MTTAWTEKCEKHLSYCSERYLPPMHIKLGLKPQFRLQRAVVDERSQARIKKEGWWARLTSYLQQRRVNAESTTNGTSETRWILWDDTAGLRKKQLWKSEQTTNWKLEYNIMVYQRSRSYCFFFEGTR
ncbi:hypothetical protein Trydic_g3535 [Trypoxylus dichotomus]